MDYAVFLCVYEETRSSADADKPAGRDVKYMFRSVENSKVMTKYD